MYPVGFHRYILENFTGDTLDGTSEHEVEEFDSQSEVSSSSAWDLMRSGDKNIILMPK